MKKTLILFLLTFNIASIFSQELNESFNQSKNNKNSLEKVLAYYKGTGDQQKYKAAVFLLKNMSIHKSIDYILLDNLNNKVPFSEFDYADFNSAMKYLEHLKDSIFIKPKKVTKLDTQFISSEILIKNIDVAFVEWKNNPWSSSYSFEVFCEYILPYRNLIEPLEDWRNEYRFLANQLDLTIEDKTDPTEVCTQIVDNLNDFTFVNSKPDPIPILSPSQMLFRREGSCPDLANFALLVCRSKGIATTFDFTPHYAASSNRHFWNTVVDSKGNHIPFNGNALNDSKESLPYIYNPIKKRVGKVFRVTYAKQKHSLATIIPPSNIPAVFLKNKNNKDVTSEYVEISDLTIDKKKFTDTIAYANVFNLGRWKVIDWARESLDIVQFKNLGRDIVYLPSTYKNKRMTYLKYPFLINKQGTQQELKPNHQESFTAVLSRDNEYKNSYMDFNTLEINEGETYTLKCWDAGWNTIGTSIATNKGVSFKNIPSNALLILLPKKKDNFERIFTIDKKSHKIYWY